MSSFSTSLEKIFPLTKNIFIPALIFGTALIGFYIKDTITIPSMLTLHTLFYVFNFVSIMILLYYNQSKSVFFIFCATLGYIVVNYLKNKYGANYQSEPLYGNLCFFMPLNLALFYFWPNHRLLIKNNVYLLLAIFIQYTLAEKLSNSDISLSLNFLAETTSGLSNSNLALFAIVLIGAFLRITLVGNILDYSLFFAMLNIMFGLLYSASPAALTIFFASASLTILIAIAQNIYYNTYKDALTGFASRDAYIIHSKDFPLKYSLGIISIDDFNKFATMFGRRNQNNLTKMVSTLITNLVHDNCVYRYSENEFVIIFKNEDKNESFIHLEEIRRAIASSAFVLNPRRNPLKLTISASISEKKRSDANHVEVLVRARKILEKTRAFSHNVTSKA